MTALPTATSAASKRSKDTVVSCGVSVAVFSTVTDIVSDAFSAVRFEGLIPLLLLLLLLRLCTVLREKIPSVARCSGGVRRSQVLRYIPPPSYHHPEPVRASA
jgi:hypothetical protein